MPKYAPSASAIVVPGRGEREHHGGRGARPGGVEQRVAALELAEPLLGGGAGRVAVARVEELARLAALVVRPDRRAVDGLPPPAEYQRRIGALEVADRA